LNVLRQSLSLLKRRVRHAQRRALAPVTALQSSLLQTSQLQLTLQYRALAQSGGPFPSFREVGFRVHSDADEDGILLYILALTGTDSRRLVDLGANGVAASNSANLLLHHGWTGVLVDADETALRAAVDHYVASGVMPPAVVSSWLTADNVNDVITANDATGADLLLIDVDGIDYWLWKAIDCMRPRVVVVEYQDILGPQRSVVVPYDPAFSVASHEVNASENNYVGASLRALVKLGADKGYRLVACNNLGFNAFFVREDLARDSLPELAVEGGFPHPWNVHGMRERYPLVADMPWVEV
jgi:hypothetical protein